MTFVRLQEFYESPSPKFRGNYFTFEEYVDWYAQTQGEGDFTYLTDWTGFNVPGHIVTDFYHRVEEGLEGGESERKRETQLFAALQKYVSVWDEEEEPYYIIGTTHNSPLNTVDHEVRHAIYYLEKGYRKEVTQEIKRKRLVGLYKALDKMGYTKEVHVDEVQAYVLTGLSEEMRETKEIKDLRKKLKQIENKYIGDKV